MLHNWGESVYLNSFSFLFWKTILLDVYDLAGLCFIWKKREQQNFNSQENGFEEVVMGIMKYWAVSSCQIRF